MSVKARILSIQLIKKIHQLPEFAGKIGLSVRLNEGTSDKTQQIEREKES